MYKAAAIFSAATFIPKKIVSTWQTGRKTWLLSLGSA
jgi:hypothetical protein